MVRKERKDMKENSLGSRMKTYYEERAESRLTRRTPVIIRIDGRAFHTFTKNFSRPYDAVFHNAMNKTTKYLCQNIQGCKFGYTQSDEISLFLTDYDTLETDAWFDYRVQKMCSIASSMATMAFNKFFAESAKKWVDDYVRQYGAFVNEQDIKLVNAHEKAIEKGAMFDARVFNIPEEEVVNYFIWRQQDATRNAIQMLGQTYFSHKELYKKSCNDIQEMLFHEKDINFNNMSVEFKRGICVWKDAGEWIMDKCIPVFTTSNGRAFIESMFPAEVKSNRGER